MMKLKCFTLLPYLGVPGTRNTPLGIVLRLGIFRSDDLASSLRLSHPGSRKAKDVKDTEVPSWHT